MRPIDVCVLQDSFSCTGGTKVVWEISVQHDKVPQLRGHNRAEVLLKVFMAQPIPGRLGQSRVTIINQIEVKHGGVSQRTKSTKSALNKFGKFQERAISYLGNRLSAPASAGYQTGAHASAAMWLSSNSSESSTDSRSHSGSSLRNDSADIAHAVDIANIADTSYTQPALGPAASPPTAAAARTSISNFELLAVIGRGGYGKVFQARLRSTGELMALKVMKKTTLSATQAARTMTERTILAEVRHPFIVSLKYAFQSTSKLYLAMDFVQGGDLYTLLRRVGVLNIALVRLFASEITLALGHLHSVGVIYRDLKPENVLLGTDGHIKLTDFGLSIWCEEGAQQQCHSFAGTETYMAPELLLQRGHDSAADWWSFGILLCEMSMGRHPFREPHIVANSERKVALSRYCTLRNIANPNVPPRLYTMAPSLRAFVQQLLCKVPKLRLGARGGVEAVMKNSFFSGVDWKTVYAKEETSPLWTAQVWHGNADVSAFDEMFTKEAPVDSVTDDVANSTASSGVFKYTFSNFAFDITVDTEI